MTDNRGGRGLSTREIRSIAMFVLISFGLAWLVALPLWFGDGIASPMLPLIAIGMMATPTIAALVMVFFVDRPQRRARALGVWPLRPVNRLIRYSLLGIFVPIALALVALPVGAALRMFPADFANFSGFRETLIIQLQEAGQATLPMPIAVIVIVQLLTLPLAAFINLIPALGEEIGWRGWLLPKLMPLGVAPAILISGVIWGLWHAPLILLGYNYPAVPAWLGQTAMIGMCIVIGAVFGWLRIRSESVWPAALAHAAFNGAGGSYLLFMMAGESVNTAEATVLGWSGWIVPLVLVVTLVATGKFRRPPSPPASDPRSTEGALDHAAHTKGPRRSER